MRAMPRSPRRCPLRTPRLTRLTAMASRRPGLPGGPHQGRRDAARLECRCEPGRQRWRHAAVHGRPGGPRRVVAALLAANADVERAVAHGFMPLFASKLGHTEIVAMLLAANATVDPSNDNEQTPMVVACCEGHRRRPAPLLLRREPHIHLHVGEGGQRRTSPPTTATTTSPPGSARPAFGRRRSTTSSSSRPIARRAAARRRRPPRRRHARRPDAALARAGGGGERRRDGGHGGLPGPRGAGAADAQHFPRRRARAVALWPGFRFSRQFSRQEQAMFDVWMTGVLGHAVTRDYHAGAAVRVFWGEKTSLSITSGRYLHLSSTTRRGELWSRNRAAHTTLHSTHFTPWRRA